MAFEITRNKWPNRLTGRVRIPQNVEFNVQNMQNRIASEGKAVSNRLRRDQRLAFSKGGHQHHGGRKWRRLMPSTIERKGHGRILVKTGSMQRRQSVRGNFRLVRRQIRWTINFVNNSPVANLHQFGFEHPRAGWVAPRPPVWISDKDAKMVQDAMKSTFRRGRG